MNNGDDILDLLEEYLKEKNMSRKVFCFLTDIPVSELYACLNQEKKLPKEYADKIKIFIANEENKIKE